MRKSETPNFDALIINTIVKDYTVNRFYLIFLNSWKKNFCINIKVIVHLVGTGTQEPKFNHPKIIFTTNFVKFPIYEVKHYFFT